MATENGIVKYDGSKFEVYNDFPTKTLNFEYFRGDIEKDKILISYGNDNLQVAIHGRESKISSISEVIPHPVIAFACAATAFSSVSLSLLSDLSNRRCKVSLPFDLLFSDFIKYI
ncbi:MULTISPECIES: hypothetical protein [unclassified Chryseobacterium]|uniref:hypothetical protein n=1 Tax=unclassified Chryseobacterium TaxID=2593645 RepID=UPI00226A9975|nr:MULTISPECIES: hypothetical protein [unclassified Chryseobacterium]